MQKRPLRLCQRRPLLALLRYFLLFGLQGPAWWPLSLAVYSISALQVFADCSDFGSEKNKKLLLHSISPVTPVRGVPLHLSADG